MESECLSYQDCNGPVPPGAKQQLNTKITALDLHWDVLSPDMGIEGEPNCSYTSIFRGLLGVSEGRMTTPTAFSSILSFIAIS